VPVWTRARSRRGNRDLTQRVKAHWQTPTLTGLVRLGLGVLLVRWPGRPGTRPSKKVGGTSESH
jgi:hypothetical protein